MSGTDPVIRARITEERQPKLALIAEYLKSIGADGSDTAVLDFALNVASAEAERRMKMAEKTLAQKIVEAYRGFYRADKLESRASCIRPLNIALEAIVDAAPMPAFAGDEALREVVMGEISYFMNRVVRHDTAGYVAPSSTYASRNAAMSAFADLVMQFWVQSHRDAAAMKGLKQGEYLRSACVGAYRQMQYAEWRAAGETPEEISSATETE